MIMVTSTNDINIQIYEIFKELGISPHLLGYKYASWIINSIIDGKLDETDKLTNLYELTSKHFNTSMTAVERCIRHMASKILRTRTLVTTYKYFGNVTSLTSGQFIMSIVEYIRMYGDNE